MGRNYTGGQGFWRPGVQLRGQKSDNRCQTRIYLKINALGLHLSLRLNLYLHLQSPEGAQLYRRRGGLAFSGPIPFILVSALHPTVMMNLFQHLILSGGLADWQTVGRFHLFWSAPYTPASC